LLGLISYSLYLWHWPILVIVTQHRGATSLPIWDNVGLLLIATLIAILSYRLLENPVRHSRFLGRRRWASVAIGLCLVAATLAVTTYEQRRPTVDLGSIATATSGALCPSPSQNVVSGLRSTFTSGHLHPTTSSYLQQVAVIGDSTSCTLLPGLQAVGPSYGMQFENGAVIGCGVVSGEVDPAYINGQNVDGYTDKCQGDANLAETEAIERFRPSLIVWGSTEEHDSIVVDTPTGSKVLTAGSREWKTVMLQRIDDRVGQFVATGARVVLLLEPPQVHTGSQQGPPNSTDRAYRQMNALLTEVAGRHPGHVATVDLEARVCPSGPPCPYVVGGLSSSGAATLTQAMAKFLRPDLVHYSFAGSLWVARWLVPRIAEAAKQLS
jgi:hypothetical protein